MSEDPIILHTLFGFPQLICTHHGSQENRIHVGTRLHFSCILARFQAVALNCSVCIECLLRSIRLVSSFRGPGGAEGKNCFWPDSFSEKLLPLLRLQTLRMGVLVRGGRDLGLACELRSSKKAPEPLRSYPERIL